MAEESPEIMNLDLNLVPAPETGLGLVSNEGVNSNEVVDVPKACENIDFSEVEVFEKMDNVEGDGSFFDCNVCLDHAREPVVTCCGHLFCWSCLYRWLNVHSDAKECPVCKGEVTEKSVTPIYGQGKVTHEPEEDSDSDLKIPPRPSARRVESWSQTIRMSAFNLPVDETIRDQTPSGHDDATRETAERARSILNRFLASRGIRIEQNTADMSSRIRSMVGRNPEQPLRVDDRDSLSSIAAVMNSESRMDNAVEIDSGVSVSGSSSRRRSDASREVDGVNPSPIRRRRLH